MPSEHTHNTARGLNRRVARQAAFAILVTAPLVLWVLNHGEPRLALQAFTRVGWGMVAVVVARAATIVLCGTAWSQLLRRCPLPQRAFQSVRFIREGFNVLLPLTAVGGDILGMRLITFWGLSGGLAIASVTVDVTLQAAAQAVFTLLGLGLLSRAYGGGWLQNVLMIGVASLAAALVVFQQLQRHGMKPLGRLLQRILSSSPLRHARGMPATPRLGLQAAFTDIWSDRTAVAAAASLHLAAWLIGVIEVWIALRCMGLSPGWEGAAMLESLSQGLRSLAFPVPAGIGVQEGGLITLGHMLGLDPGAALAVSMVKRVPDIVLGTPALLAWLGLEALHTRNSRPPA